MVAFLSSPSPCDLASLCVNVLVFKMWRITVPTTSSWELDEIMYESADKSDWGTTTQYMAAIMIFSDTSYNLASPATGI